MKYMDISMGGTLYIIHKAGSLNHPPDQLPIALSNIHVCEWFGIPLRPHAYLY